MSTSTLRQVLVLALSLTALPAALSAQQKPAPAPAPAAADTAQDPQAWIMEIQQLHTKLQAIQEKALADPQLRASQETLGSNIKLAMEKADPTLDQKLNRMKELQTQAQTAQAAQDTAKLQQLGTEARQIEEQFMITQQKVLQQPEIASQVSAFQDQLQKKMVAADPSAAQLIARFEELQQRLAKVMPSDQ
jgi:hypothetical protein